jgi:hypothetical protein
MFESIVMIIAVFSCVIMAVNFNSITKLWQLYLDLDTKKADDTLRLHCYIQQLENRIKELEDKYGE